MGGKGFRSIAASNNFGPANVGHLYHLREASEKQHIVMKSQLGFSTPRVHRTEVIENRLAMHFIAYILRCEIMAACQELGFEANQMIREIDRITLILMMDGLYGAINNQSGRQKDLLQKFGVHPEYFKTFADDVNCRMPNPIQSQIYRLSGNPADVRGKETWASS